MARPGCEHCRPRRPAPPERRYDLGLLWPRDLAAAYPERVRSDMARGLGDVIGRAQADGAVALDVDDAQLEVSDVPAREGEGVRVPTVRVNIAGCPVAALDAPPSWPACTRYVLRP